MVIWKYLLDCVDEQQIQMPRGAQLLSVANQGGCVCLWAMVDPSQRQTESRRFMLAGTGVPIEKHLTPAMRFIGTVVTGPFVWHIFELV